jgi:hypothetical protein
MSALSLAHLYEKMAQEQPLTESDTRIFLANLPLILDLGQDPALIGRLREVSGWTENRLIYVVTKINLGLLTLFDPANPRLRAAPEFTRPLAEELSLLEGHREDFNRALTRLLGRPR